MAAALFSYMPSSNHRPRKPNMAMRSKADESAFDASKIQAAIISRRESAASERLSMASTYAA